MNHEEFTQKWNEGLLEIDVDCSKSLQVANSNMLPKQYQFSLIFWSTVWLVSIPFAILMMIFYKWWIGLLIFIFVTPIIFKATKKVTMQFMIDHSVDNQEFYDIAVKEGVIRVREKQQTGKTWKPLPRRLHASRLQIANSARGKIPVRQIS